MFRSTPQPVLAIHAAPILFLHTPELSTVIPVRDGSTLLNGSLSLRLPTAKRVDLSVSLAGTAKTKKERFETTVGPLTLDVGLLGPGDHTFAFTLEVPNNTAPTERCPLGSVDYALVAKLDGISAERPIAISAVPSLEGQPPAGLNAEVEGTTDGIGHWKLVLRSALLSVGGILGIHFDHDPTETYATCGYTLDLVQTVQLASDQSVVETTRFSLLSLDIDVPTCVNPLDDLTVSDARSVIFSLAARPGKSNDRSSST